MHETILSAFLNDQLMIVGRLCQTPSYKASGVSQKRPTIPHDGTERVPAHLCRSCDLVFAEICAQGNGRSLIEQDAH
jgi:hypothetical protein